MSIDNSDAEVLDAAISWLADQHQVVLVTVVNTWGSSPRPVGSIAAVREDGVLVGSVSGGCVEKQLVELFRKQSRERVHSYHIDDSEARRYGLACGGSLELVFETLENSDSLQQVQTQLLARQRVVREVQLETMQNQVRVAGADDAFSYDGKTLKQFFGPGWRVLLIGAGQLSRFTAEFALALDFEVIVCDPRPEFRAGWQVTGANVIDLSPDDAVLQYATDANSAVLALTHDPNHDDLALLEALPSQAFYVGALGSRRNNEGRKKRLAALDVTEAELQRLSGPIGIDIGSRTSAEIAISIAAELVMFRSKVVTD